MNKTGTPEPNRGRALLGLLAIMALIVAVLFIMHRLNQAARIQDCADRGAGDTGLMIAGMCSYRPVDLLDRISSTLRRNAPYAI